MMILFIPLVIKERVSTFLPIQTHAGLHCFIIAESKFYHYWKNSVKYIFI